MRKTATFCLAFVALSVASLAFADEPAPNSGDGPIDDLIEQTEPVREEVEALATALQCNPAPSCIEAYLISTYGVGLFQIVAPVVDNLATSGSLVTGPADGVWFAALQACGAPCTEILYGQLLGAEGQMHDAGFDGNFWSDFGKCASTFGTMSAAAAFKTGGPAAAGWWGGATVAACFFYSLMN